MKIQELLLPIIGALSPNRKIEIAELWPGSRALFLSVLRSETKRPIVLITATDDDAMRLADDIRFFMESMLSDSGNTHSVVLALPSWNVLPFSQDPPDSGTVGERMFFLYHIISRRSGIYIISVRSLMQKLPPLQLFTDSVITLSVGMGLDPDSLANRLVTVGYELSSAVTRIGEFRRQGGILDLFSPSRANPVRLEFYGDTIESIREFDPETQRSTMEIKEAVVLPVREIILTPEGIERINIDSSLKAIGDPLIEGLRRGDIPDGAEFLSPLLYEMESVFSYFPKDAIVALNEPDDILAAADAFWKKVVSGREEEIGQGRFLPQAEEVYIDPADAFRTGVSYPQLELRLIPSSSEAIGMGTISIASLGIGLSQPQAKAKDEKSQLSEGGVSGLVQRLRSLSTENLVTIVCGTDESKDRLMNMLSEYELVITSSRPAISEGPTPVYVTTGRLHEGFFWPAINLVYITEEEIFGRKVHRPPLRPPKISPFLSSFKELKPGDFVVHRDYGVGKYMGLTHISVDGFDTEYLTIRYEPEAKLYVPLYSLDKVQKYIGMEGSEPKIDRLGAQRWARTKEKVKKDILEMARGLVEIYAAREAMERPAFSPPDSLYREFESSFPYEETPDQKRAIEDVLFDMQRPRPMDRLVCGDVGYGKTEVALRAAFKAVEDGFQVAVLVPTTILADQHFRTFSSRLEMFSVKVEMLSRFRSRQEQKEILRGMKDGRIDIVIGTHRLLQKDVSFRNLGLLVVDEEHRFGVRHKERIKELKKLVDVLTLTATPIPRTLHMSLSGLRDLSIIQTPPLDRQAIQVILARFGPRVIAEAITNELSRGGLVFFVHNRVHDIEKMADFIRNLVPEARVGVAHGQMPEDRMEEVMSGFISGRINVLVTTTIIESGIDIPEANTIIINRADRFGLSELYQIKGRVGRSREKAYAYLLTPPEEVLSETARKRLRAIQELSELGAGFRIAAQDLETRGAGNLLGKQQSGHIAAVGIDLYTEMMEEAVAELRGRPLERKTDTQINLRASAFLPEDYIGDIGQRLAVYKQISAISNDNEAEELMQELRDRYGEPPEQALNLIEIMKIKAACREARVARVDQARDAVTITFSEDANIPPERVMTLLKRNKGRISLVSEFSLRIEIADGTVTDVSDAVKKCLQELV